MDQNLTKINGSINKCKNVLIYLSQVANSSSAAVELVSPRVISKHVKMESCRLRTISFDRQHGLLGSRIGCWLCCSYSSTRLSTYDRALNELKKLKRQKVFVRSYKVHLLSEQGSPDLVVTDSFFRGCEFECKYWIISVKFGVGT